MWFGCSKDSSFISKWELLLKERICSQRERFFSFTSSSLWYGKSLLPTYVLHLEIINDFYIPTQWRSQNAEKGTHIKGDYGIKQWFCSTASLFKIVTSLKGKNLLLEGMENHFYHIR